MRYYFRYYPHSLCSPCSPKLRSYHTQSLPIARGLHAAGIQRTGILPPMKKSQPTLSTSDSQKSPGRAQRSKSTGTPDTMMGSTWNLGERTPVVG